MPVGEGANLGTASGRIIIDLSDLQNVRVITQQVGQDAERNLSRIGTGAARAQGNFRNLAGQLRGFAGAFGIAFGAAGIRQIARFELQSEDLATSYRRQQVAALNLAGTQEKLNELLEAYDRATGGTVDRATALADVTRLQATGFANNVVELERFTRAARGSSIAMGRLQSEMSQEIQLAISNQSFRRLDQIGLGIEEVNERIDQLRANNRGMTREAAFQEAILGLLNEKFGDLTKSTEGQRSGTERLGVAFKNTRLRFGELIRVPVGAFGNAAAIAMERVNRVLEAEIVIIEGLISAWNRLRGTIPAVDISAGIAQSDALMLSRGQRMASSSFGANLDEDQRALVRERFDAVQQIERDANEARLDATRQYEEQRSSTIREYGKAIAREADDFGRQRLRAEEEFAASIADVREDAARREARQLADLERVERQGRTDTDERIAELREDTAERLLELEEDYARNRERATRKHRENLLNAASRLDARAVAEEQRRFVRESMDAAEAHDDQRSDLREQLAERIEDEEEALAKSNRQRREAFERQLQEQREADDRRIRDMTDDFERQKRLEDEDRAIRLQRMAQDHQDRLGEMARQHALDLAQIRRNAVEARRQVQDDFQKALNELGLATDAWIAQNKRLTDAAIKDFTRWRDAVNSAFAQQEQGGPGLSKRPLLAYQSGGPVMQTGPTFLHAGEFVLSRQMLSQGAGLGALTVNIAVNGAGSDGNGIAVAIRTELESLFRSLS